MKYLLLFHLPVDGEQRFTGEATSERAGYVGVMEELRGRGAYLGGEPLQPPPYATQVRVRDDEALIIDGPVAELAEQVAGYFLVEARDLDEAIEIARRIPAARSGTVEIRPVLEDEE